MVELKGIQQCTASRHSQIAASNSQSEPPSPKFSAWFLVLASISNQENRGFPDYHLLLVLGR